MSAVDRPSDGQGRAELLRLAGISKVYPGTVANDAVDLTVAKGEIHALLGENGAGKSTLVKIIYGLVRPDAGRMWLDRAEYQPADPAAARRSGVGMVFQHFSTFDALDVAENVALGMVNPPPRRQLRERIAEVSRAYGLPLDPDRLVGQLSAGEQQRVEIVRCLLQSPRLLIMDEPTSVLTPDEAGQLFATLRRLAAEGTAILYISHKLAEVQDLCSRATILRGGRRVADCDPGACSVGELAELMVGATLRPPARQAPTRGDRVLQVDGLSLPAGHPFGTSLTAVSFAVHAGEVVGIAGIAGNGQDELLAALSGERTSPAETLKLRGRSIGGLGPTPRRALGLLAAPEQRLGHAAAPRLSLAENVLITARDRRNLVRAGLVRWPEARRYARSVIDRFDVRSAQPGAPAGALSGGNLQKFVIGREILQDPEVLVINQPTWGVDARAAAAIRQALLDLADRGGAVVVISQDLDELLEVSDRLAVLSEGRLGALQATATLTRERIGRLLGGVMDGGVDREQRAC